MKYIAIYCRVSTGKEDQVNSFEAQQRYFKSYIENKPDWILYNIYADEGITGTCTKNRTQFNKMIQDAQRGFFQIIITKEVSRFSRNILDTIRYTRELKAMGVNVLFLNDGINTFDPDSELRLSIMASIAQEESRKTSQRVVWGQTRQMERGIVFGRSMLGYDVSDGIIKINPEGAALVRLIYQKYVDEQMSAGEIAAYLTSKGYPTFTGNKEWNPSVIVKILRNEKYVGDLIQKKTYTSDYLTHEKKINKGEVPFIKLENHHEPIVSRQMWNAAQDKLHNNSRHTRDSKDRTGSHLFSGKIRCGICGGAFVSRTKKRKDGTGYRRWCCSGAVNGSGCKIGILIRDDDALQMLKTALIHLPIDREKVIEEVGELVSTAFQIEQGNKEKETQRLKSNLEYAIRKSEAVLDRFFAGDITKEEMRTMQDKYTYQIEKYRLQLESYSAGIEERQNMEEIDRALRLIINCEITSEGFFRYFLESIIVHPDRSIYIKFQKLKMIFSFTKEI